VHILPECLLAPGRARCRVTSRVDSALASIGGCGVLEALMFGAALAASSLVYAGVDWLHPPLLRDPAGAAALGAEIARRPRRVLAVAAHPDDVEWYAGGLLALLREAGSQIDVLMATDGELRSAGRQASRVRREEQLEAARRMGYRSTRFLALGDGRLVWRTGKLVAAIDRACREIGPDLLISFEFRRPKLPYLHPDHLAVGRAVGRVWGCLPGARPQLLLFSSAHPDLVADISGVIERKLHALAAHRSQGYRPGGRSYVLTMARAAGRAIDAEYAEAYRLHPPGPPHCAEQTS